MIDNALLYRIDQKLQLLLEAVENLRPTVYTKLCRRCGTLFPSRYRKYDEMCRDCRLVIRAEDEARQAALARMPDLPVRLHNGLKRAQVPAEKILDLTEEEWCQQQNLGRKTYAIYREHADRARANGAVPPERSEG